jgi:hypothetical protein
MAQLRKAFEAAAKGKPQGFRTSPPGTGVGQRSCFQKKIDPDIPIAIVPAILKS